jgi:maltoporin
MYYTYDPFTQFGVVASTRLNKNWVVQAGINAGNDVAPTQKDARPTFTGCIQHITDDSKDTIYLCDNGTNDAGYGFNNVNLYQFMWYHKFTDRLWVASEDYYEYMVNVPTAFTNQTLPGETAAQFASSIPALIPGSNPALCHTGQTKCDAGAYAASVYVMYKLTPMDYVGVRAEAFDDVRGQRTGYATWYGETTLGWTHWLSKSVEVRPEIRFDHSFEATAYDNGARSSQVTIGSDLLVKY